MSCNQENNHKADEAIITPEQLPSEHIAERLRMVHVFGPLDQFTELQSELARQAWQLGADFVCAVRVVILEEGLTHLVSKWVPTGLDGNDGEVRVEAEEARSPRIMVYGLAVKTVGRAAVEEHAENVNILTLWDENALSSGTDN